MGNHQGGQIYISLESNKVNVGDILSGSVHIYLKEQISDPHLLLIFKGSESVEFNTVETSYNRNKTNIRFIKHTGKQAICELKVMLLAWKNATVFPGNYSFPFQIKIYDSILPTFSSIFDSSGFAKIEYKIKAQLQAKSLNPIKYKQTISVFASKLKLSQALYPSKTMNESVGRGCFLFCYKNEISIAKIWIDGYRFAKSDSIDINLETNLSNFSARIKRVEIEMMKVISVTANKTNKMIKSESQKIWKKNFYPEIMPRSGVQVQKFTIAVVEMLANENCFTMKSSLIKCQYVIRVKLHTDYYCCKCYGFEEVNQGVVILPLPVEVERVPPPIPPEEWKSSVLPCSSISYETQDTMSSNTALIKSFVSVPLLDSE
ncbi:unnamed protein product [Blepharisma stoltei]|uniref:Arrestin-like N-terminal domain-containing protein n=1 Tax=Blepharisma stoltei TaxID=1481888 RepID=A0AAU9IHX7_9CILI|nr:unnamed protein product [Blepharisma stoltei]